MDCCKRSSLPRCDACGSNLIRAEIDESEQKANCVRPSPHNHCTHGPGNDGLWVQRGHFLHIQLGILPDYRGRKAGKLHPIHLCFNREAFVGLSNGEIYLIPNLVSMEKVTPICVASLGSAVITIGMAGTPGNAFRAQPLKIVTCMFTGCPQRALVIVLAGVVFSVAFRASPLLPNLIQTMCRHQ